MSTREQIEAAKAYYAACNHSDWDAVVAGMLTAAEKLAPIAAPRAFEVTEKLVQRGAVAIMQSEHEMHPSKQLAVSRLVLEAVSAELGKAQSSAGEQAGEWTTADYGQAEFACLKAIEAAESLYPDADTLSRAALDAVSYRLQPQPAASAGERAEWTAEDEIAAARAVSLETADVDSLSDDDFRIARAVMKALKCRLQPQPVSAGEQAGEWTEADYDAASTAIAECVDPDGEGPSFGELAGAALDAVKYRLQPQPAACEPERAPVKVERSKEWWLEKARQEEGHEVAAGEPERTSPDSTLEALEQTIIDGACDGVVSDEFSAALAELVRRAKASASEPERAKAFDAAERIGAIEGHLIALRRHLGCEP